MGVIGIRGAGNKGINGDDGDNDDDDEIIEIRRVEHAVSQRWRWYVRVVWDYGGCGCGFGLALVHATAYVGVVESA